MLPSPIQLHKRLFPFVRFGFVVKNHYQHSVHDGFAPFIWISLAKLSNAKQAPSVSSSKRSSSSIAGVAISSRIREVREKLWCIVDSELEAALASSFEAVLLMSLARTLFVRTW